MKKLLLHFLFFYLLMSWVSAQTYKEMMADSRVNVYDVIEEAERYFSTHDKGKGSGWKGYQRWRERNESRFFPSGDRSRFQPSSAWDEFEAFKQQHSTRMGTESWRDLGPYSASDLLPPSWAAGVGRIEAVWADWTTGDTIYLGSRSGGFWKSVDDGATWRATTQELPAVGVIDIDVHPNRSNEVWIVTRHATGYSLGLMKSMDYGETWDTTSLSFLVDDNERLDELWISELVPNTMYCNSNTGIYKTTDGGQNWQKIVNGNVRAFAMKPGDPNGLYWIFNNDKDYVQVSTDGGQTYTATHIPANNGGGSRLAVSNANPNGLYFSSSNGVWRSLDGGATFTMMGSAPASWMAFGVNDLNFDLVVWGSLDQYISYDGGANFTKFTSWANFNSANYVHADGRVFQSWDGVMYLGTDGYLARSTDNGNTWNKLNEYGTGVREFYRIGCSVTDADRINGGSQDNGTSVYLDGVWKEWIGADGMECHFDRNNDDIWFGTIQNGALRRTTNGGFNSQSIRPDESGQWITPSVVDPSNENTLFIAYDTLYKSTDNGTNWEALADFASFGTMKHLAIAPSDSNFLYIARNRDILRSTDNGITFTAITGLPNLNIERIAVHPFDPLTLAVVLSGYDANEKVYRSNDGGLSWTNLTANLPNLPANAIVFEEDESNRMYLGMDVGVYYYDDFTAGNWVLYADSMPAVEIRDLEIQHGANYLRAATWGRGLWEVSLVGQENDPQVLEIDIDPVVDYTRPSAADSVHINALVTDDGSVNEVYLYWGFDMAGQNLSNIIPMNVLSGNTYRTSSPILPQPLNTNVYFRVMATDNTNDTTWSDKIMYRTKEAILCDAEGASGTGGDYITQVNLNTLNSISGKANYTDFTNRNTELSIDSTYQLSIQLNFSFDPDSVFAWIDWNQNLVFESGSDEQVVMSELDNLHLSTGNVTVPSTAPLDTVVMRVRNIYDTNGAFADPCGSYFGEVEDYSLILREGIALPVEILDFKAELQAEGVLLHWLTGNAEQADHFEVQRSLNAQEWESVKRLPAQAHQQYTVTDIYPYAGKSYYRLKQIDQDGSVYLSHIEELWIDDVNKHIRVFPSPATTEIIILHHPDREMQEVHLLSIEGKEIPVSVQKSQGQFVLDVQDLPKGMYVLKILGKGFAFHQQVLISD